MYRRPVSAISRDSPKQASRECSFPKALQNEHKLNIFLMQFHTGLLLRYGLDYRNTKVDGFHKNMLFP